MLVWTARLLSLFTPGPTRTVVLIWLGWAVLLTGFQWFAPARLALARPDYATAWTPQETGLRSHVDQPYLNGRVLNDHVAWDSEYYLSIALHGYRDPAMLSVAPGVDPGDPMPEPKGRRPGWVSLDDAFFPAYPTLIRILSEPALLLGADPIATATVAGVAISLIGTLCAMLALYDLAGGASEEPEGLRTVFYLLIMPASFFLAQVYTEGMFAGLSLGAIAMARRKQLPVAVGLAVLATWTRATGILLVIPLAWDWLAEGGIRRLGARPPGKGWIAPLLIACPVVAYLLWRMVLGKGFAVVEEHYFGRAAFALGASWSSWVDAATALFKGPPASQAYYLIEFAGLGVGTLTALAIWPRDKAFALYGLAIVAVAATSGAALGMHRYILAMPALYLAPARWARSPLFDRLWTLGNVLVMGVFALAFSADFWAG